MAIIRSGRRRYGGGVVVDGSAARASGTAPAPVRPGRYFTHRLWARSYFGRSLWGLGPGVAPGRAPAGGFFEVHLPGGRITVYAVRGGDENVSVVTLEGREIELQRLAGSAFSFMPVWLDDDDVEYQPSTVHVKVLLDGPTGPQQIVAKTEVEGWTSGTKIKAPASWTYLVNESDPFEKHIVRVIADDADDGERNELRMIIICDNPER